MLIERQYKETKMNDKLTSPDDNDEKRSDEEEQGIFDERFNVLMNGFGKACEDNNVKVAIAIAIHPLEKEPMVFARGHDYDIAVLLSDLLRNLKHSLIARLDIDQNISQDDSDH